MNLKSSLCTFCSKPRIFIAEHTQWSIHLAGHREDIIQYMVDTYPSCVLCSYPEQFASKSRAAAHIRWAHSKRELISWAFDNLGKIPNSQLFVVS
jgi:hypothetical protein